MRTFSNVWKKFRENGPAYRKAFVSSQVKRLIPFQIYALRKKRGWSQEELAKRSGLTQGVISRAEDPDYGNMTFNTVINIAGGLDVAFIGKFVPFSELDDYVVGLSEESAGSIPSFAEENDTIERLTAEREAITAGLAASQQQAIPDEEEEKEEQKVVPIDKLLAGQGRQQRFSLPASFNRGEHVNAAIGGAGC